MDGPRGPRGQPGAGIKGDKVQESRRGIRCAAEASACLTQDKAAPKWGDVGLAGDWPAEWKKLNEKESRDKTLFFFYDHLTDFPGSAPHAGHQGKVKVLFGHHWNED